MWHLPLADIRYIDRLDRLRICRGDVRDFNLGELRSGRRKRAFIFAVIAALAGPAAYYLFRLFFERTIGSA